ncbi:hypothetical protein [Paenibacillus sp.]|uniref:hypothetical protein n=1 Tax=Paenibacillus sp. TaxID=58172 RepID=UPI00281205C9|nr:hypothetical protein [Paenibacillus sp.]
MNRVYVKKGGLLLAAALIAVLAACSGGGAKEEAVDPPVADGATQGEAETPAAPEQPANEQTPPAEAPVADAKELPERTELNVTVEGMTEAVPASLTESELGYVFYLMEGFEFTPEEPGKDMVFHKEFPEFFLRIEPLPEDTDLTALRSSAEDALKAVGDNVADMKETFFDEDIRVKAAFILHASGASGSVNMIAMEIDDKLFRFTLNFPNSEAAEGVSPRFYPMIRSIVVPK